LDDFLLNPLGPQQSNHDVQIEIVRQVLRSLNFFLKLLQSSYTILY